MDKITQALKKILPAEQIAEVARAVEEAFAAQLEDVREQAQAELDAAYEQLSGEREQDKLKAHEGYKQAYEIIHHLMNRIDEQREEFEHALEEGFDEAFAELEQEKDKNKNIELELYEEFDRKLKQMKSIMVDKVDQFMGLQEQEIYESAKRDVLSDPHLLEQRVAVEKIKAILSDDLTDGSFEAGSSSRLEEAVKTIDALKGHVRLLESKNVKLSLANSKLNEQVDEAHGIITEATKVERKQRTNRRGIASGRGQRVVNEQLISEYAAPAKHSANVDQDLTEGHDPLNDLLVLSGLDEQFYEHAAEQKARKQQIRN